MDILTEKISSVVGCIIAKTADLTIFHSKDMLLLPVIDNRRNLCQYNDGILFLEKWIMKKLFICSSSLR